MTTDEDDDQQAKVLHVSARHRARSIQAEPVNNTELERMRANASDNAAEAANLLEELTDEWEARQDWEEDLRDPRAWWRRKLKKAWEATQTVAGLALVLAIGWGIYDQYPASRSIIEGLSVLVVVLGLLSIPGVIRRARRRRRREREFIRRELATI
jgi:ferric-dicitrate binding protein FerR (iron transport regulator)